MLWIERACCIDWVWSVKQKYRSSEVAKQTKCLVTGCDRDVECPKSGLCKRCYSGLYYWSKKSVTEVVQRKLKLRLFMNRMDIVEPTVSALPTKKGVK